MEYKCKICAGSLTVDSKIRVAVCDYCGTKQTLPLFSDDSSKRLYDRGNQYLLHNEYDKAENIFNQLLSVNPNDAEVYWNLVLCKYGVTYAKDPKTGRYIPTCNRTHTDSILKDDNYLRAIELSVGEKLELYKRDAGIIDDIQKGILEVSRKENPFDIFISYKETDENGNRTKDSIEAQKIYDKLTDLGYKVFFSRITLESKIGEEYEPYIYAALSSSKIMITMSSSADNLNSAWVENEWSRFLTLRRGDTSKTLIPVYFDMDKEELPEQFALLSAQNLYDDDFEQEFIRGIKKLIPLPIELKAKRKRRNRIIAICAVVVLAIGGVGGGYYLYQYSKEAKIAAEVQAEIDKAMDLYNSHNYAEATWALQKMDAENASVKEALEKSKKAWRDSLGTVALSVVIAENDEFGNSYPQGSYYINGNGGVDTMSSDPGKLNVIISPESMENIDGQIVSGQLKNNANAKNIGVNEHGKVVSIGMNFPGLYGLYEDGYVCNSAVLNNLQQDWENIIQITDRFGLSNFALKDDGTVVYGNVSSSNSRASRVGFDEDWLKQVNEWRNIVKIEGWVEENDIEGRMSNAVLLGLNNEGKVYYVIYEYTNSRAQFSKSISHKTELKSFLEGLSDIKDIQASKSVIAVFDNKGDVSIFDFRDGSITKKSNIESVWSDKDNIYVVDSNRTLSKLNGNMKGIQDVESSIKLLDGVVYIRKGYCVTQSGNIYKCDGSSTGAKTLVKDVW